MKHGWDDILHFLFNAVLVGFDHRHGEPGWKPNAI